MIFLDHRHQLAHSPIHHKFIEIAMMTNDLSENADQFRMNVNRALH